MMKLACVVVDDEPIARKGMEEYVREVDFLQLLGSCGSAAEAASFLSQQRVDLLLLDIQMPRLTGLEFLRTLKNPPMTILTTAFGEYALEGYALDVLDYLVKPVPFDRFLRAVQKGMDYYQLLNRPVDVPAKEYFFVKSNGKYERVAFSDILFVESMQNYVVIHLTTQKLIVYMTMSGMEAELPKQQFMRVHKSFIVAVDKVTAIDNHEILIQQKRIPFSRTLKEAVMKRVLGNDLLSR